MTGKNVLLNQSWYLDKRRLLDIPFWLNAIPSRVCRGFRNRDHAYILTVVLPQRILALLLLRKLSTFRLFLRHIYTFDRFRLFVLLFFLLTVLLVRTILRTILAFASGGTAMVELALFSLLPASLRYFLVESIPHYLLGYSCVVLFNFVR